MYPREPMRSLAAHRECAAGLGAVRIAARGLAAWLRTLKAPAGVRREVDSLGRRAQRALTEVLAGEVGRWRPPALYSDDPRWRSRRVGHPGPALRALDAALARVDAGVRAARLASRLHRHDPRWRAVAAAQARDAAAVEEARALARDLAARAIQAAWRRAWYVPGMAVWRTRMRREFQELQAEFSGG